MSSKSLILPSQLTDNDTKAHKQTKYMQIKPKKNSYFKMMWDFCCFTEQKVSLSRRWLDEPQGIYVEKDTNWYTLYLTPNVYKLSQIYTNKKVTFQQDSNTWICFEKQIENQQTWCEIRLKLHTQSKIWSKTVPWLCVPECVKERETHKLYSCWLVFTLNINNSAAATLKLNQSTVSLKFNIHKKL